MRRPKSEFVHKKPEKHARKVGVYDEDTRKMRKR